jgi:hypothetical protein
MHKIETKIDLRELLYLTGEMQISVVIVFYPAEDASGVIFYPGFAA